MSSAEAAQVRAEVLLREHLTPAQLADYEVHQAFNVTVPSGRTWRIILPCLPGFWTLIDPGGRTRGVFLTQEGWDFGKPYPFEDHMLGVLLVLSSDARSWPTGVFPRKMLNGEAYINKLACTGPSPFAINHFPPYAPEIQHFYREAR